MWCLGSPSTMDNVTVCLILPAEIASIMWSIRRLADSCLSGQKTKHLTGQEWGIASALWQICGNCSTVVPSRSLWGGCEEFNLWYVRERDAGHHIIAASTDNKTAKQAELGIKDQRQHKQSAMTWPVNSSPQTVFINRRACKERQSSQPGSLRAVRTDCPLVCSEYVNFITQLLSVL